MQKRTTLSDRQEMATLREEGFSYQAIAQATGYSWEAVRHICRAYRDHGADGLLPHSPGRPAQGMLSTFEPIVRYVGLRLKLEHPRDGPDVILADMRIRPSLQGRLLPSAASLGRYYQSFGDRLIVPRAHLQLPRESGQLTPGRQPHEVWELDFDEGLHLPPLGWLNVMNLTDFWTGLKVGSFVHDGGAPPKRHLISWEQMRDDFRQAFYQWGLPRVIRTDRDRRLVAPGNYPVPMPFTLWLVGLGIRHETIRRVTQNGQVERSHRTWESRLLYPPPCDNLEAFQDLVGYQTWRMNAVLPSRARQCKRRPPLVAYPSARDNPRYFLPREELLIFDMQRVYDYLASGRWLRHTSASGQFHFQNDMLNVTTRYKRSIVVITFDRCLNQFLVTPAQSNQVLLRFQPNWLSIAAITGLQGV